MRSISLKAIYVLALTLIFSGALCAFLQFDYLQQKRHSEEILLEQARTFSREMDAVWSFMDYSQNVINTDSDGNYVFKGLHCAVVGKSVGAIFSFQSDYAIRYVNFNPRNDQDYPDDFETEALLAFAEDPQNREYYGPATYQGNEVYRYVLALDVDETCLDCHGEPVGSLDITGHEREGWKLGDVGGAISIVIPVDQQEEQLREALANDLEFFLAVLVVMAAVILGVTSFFVFRPMKRLQTGFGQLKDHHLDVEVDASGAAKEMDELIGRFNETVGELNGLYTNLEERVAARTLDLKAANEALEIQRDKLAVLSEELSKESRFKSDLLSMVNHELRTPLTGILSMAQIMLEGRRRENLDEAEIYGWEEVRKNGSILLEMVNNLLDMARGDAGFLRASVEWLDVGDLVSSIHDSLSPLAKRFKVDLKTHVEADVPLVLGDYDMFHRMLENLVGNGIKFTPDGGNVEVLAARVDDGVALCVKDTGIGIAPEEQERIFEKFYQVDSTSTRKYNGSGMGLALVREYCDLQGYTVTVESTLGEGATFVVHIPESCVAGEE